MANLIPQPWTFYGGLWHQAPEGVAPTPPPYGLLWADGVEPVESTLFPLSSGKRIWYVDLDAATDGNGDIDTPHNNFTDLIRV